MNPFHAFVCSELTPKQRLLMTKSVGHDVARLGTLKGIGLFLLFLVLSPLLVLFILPYILSRNWVEMRKRQQNMLKLVDKLVPAVVIVSLLALYPLMLVASLVLVSAASLQYSCRKKSS